MSRIAKRPICGKALKASITRGFVGRIFTRAASPVLRKSGFSGFGAPVFGSRAGRRSGRFVGVGGTVSWFNAATRAGPLYHAILDDAFTMFSPLYELIGMKGTLSTL